MRVIAYCYQDQESDAQALLELSNDNVHQHYVDQAIPSSPGYRPQLRQLLTDNRTDPADILLVAGFDALGNTLEEVGQCITELEHQGTAVIAWNANAPDQTLSAQTSGAALSKVALLQLAGEVQNRQRSRQLKAGHARNRLKTLPPPGKAPYGYRRGQERYIIDRMAAPVVTAFVEEFLLYGSLRGAVRFVERRFGKRISVSTGRRWLTHPVYRGDLQYGDGQVMRDTHAAIISRMPPPKSIAFCAVTASSPPELPGHCGPSPGW